MPIALEVATIPPRETAVSLLRGLRPKAKRVRSATVPQQTDPPGLQQPQTGQQLTSLIHRGDPVVLHPTTPLQVLLRH